MMGPLQLPKYQKEQGINIPDYNDLAKKIAHQSAIYIQTIIEQAQ